MRITKQQAYEIGFKYIYPQRFEKWKECVENRFADLYLGADLICALKAMEVLHKWKPLKYVKKMISNEQLSGGSYTMVLRILLNFSKRGTNYARKYEPKIAEKKAEWFEQIDRENMSYEPESTRKKYTRKFLKEKQEILQLNKKENS
jgi:hypothetical protein